MTKKDEQNAQIDAMAAKVEANAKTSGGTVTFDIDAYHSCLPEELKPELTKLHDKHRELYMAATAKAFGKISESAMVADASVKKMELTAALGEGIAWNGQYDRERRFPGIGKAEPSITYGFTSFRLTYEGARGSVAPLSGIREALAKSAATCFGG